MLCLTPYPTRVADMCRWSVSGRQHVIMCLVCGWLEHLVPEFNSQKLKQLSEVAAMNNYRHTIKSLFKGHLCCI